MPPISINRFQDASQIGGTLKLSNDANQPIKNTGTNFFGKVAAWFNTKLHPGTVSSENKAVMQSFMQALRDTYKGDIGDMAANSLQRDFASGKPLTSRKVQTAISQAQSQQKLRHDTNELAILRFAHDDSNTGQTNFGTLFTQVCREKHFVPDGNFDLKQVQNEVAREIRLACQIEGKADMKVISENEAKQIALKFINSNIQKHINDGVGTNYSEGNGFKQVFAEVSHELGFNVDLSAMDLSKLSGKIYKEVLAEGLVVVDGNATSDRQPISEQTAKEVTKREVMKFVKLKQSLFNHLDTLNIPPQHQAFMKDLVLKNPDIKSKEYLTMVWDLRTSAGPVLSSLTAEPFSRSDFMQNLYKLNDKIGEKGRALVAADPETGANELASLEDHSLMIGLEVSDLSKPEMQKMLDVFSSREVKELNESLGFFASGDDTATNVRDEIVLARRMDNISKSALGVIGKVLGKSMDELAPMDTEPPSIDARSKVPPDITNALVQLNFQLYTPNTSFDSVLASKQGVRDFEAFSKTKQCEENIYFFQNVADYKKLPANEQQKVAQHITDQFIKDDAPFQINVDDSIRQQIMQDLAAGQLTNLFDSASTHIKMVMEQDTFPKFLSSNG
ncbi:MAG: hypothetical protein HQK77_00845 [Desulfobacterales bacterium]|nr:hypothetical protein [Desulfobacterales bacterium]